MPVVEPGIFLSPHTTGRCPIGAVVKNPEILIMSVTLRRPGWTSLHWIHFDALSIHERQGCLVAMVPPKNPLTLRPPKPSHELYPSSSGEGSCVGRDSLLTSHFSQSLRFVRRSLNEGGSLSPSVSKSPLLIISSPVTRHSSLKKITHLQKHVIHGKAIGTTGSGFLVDVPDLK